MKGFGKNQNSGQDVQYHFRFLEQDAQKLTGRTAREPLSLLTIPDGIRRNPEKIGKFPLAEVHTFPKLANITGHLL